MDRKSASLAGARRATPRPPHHPRSGRAGGGVGVHEGASLAAASRRQRLRATRRAHACALRPRALAARRAEAEEHPGGAARGPVQRGGIHEPLHVAWREGGEGGDRGVGGEARRLPAPPPPRHTHGPRLAPPPPRQGEAAAVGEACGESPPPRACAAPRRHPRAPLRAQSRRGASTDAGLCSTIYNMCTQKPPHDYSQQLYERYRESFNEYIVQKARESGWLRVC